MLTIVLVALSFGINATIWGAVGCLRWLIDRGGRTAGPPRVGRDEVALLCAARNEESVINGLLTTAAGQLPLAQVYLVSDRSTDRTAELALLAGANVLELTHNLGKAGALSAGLAHFDLCQKYGVVVIADADTEFSDDYLDTGLPLFNDPGVAAVAGMAHTLWRPSELSRLGRMLVSYRERLYLYSQHMFKYGQGWAWANAVTVAPGFASMYKTWALEKLPIDAPGLVIEDFNMTFEIHRQRLGRIAFHPRAAVAYTQDPDNLGDYRRQVGRWALGYWQSARRFLRRPGAFAFFLTLLSVETALSYLVFALAPLAVLVWGLAELTDALGGGRGSVAAAVVRTHLPLRLIVAMLVPDLLVTLAAAAYQRRLTYLKWALAFPLLHALDAWLGLRSLVRTFTVRSTGIWISPSRRTSAATSRPQLAAATPVRVATKRRSFARSSVVGIVALTGLLAVLTTAYGNHVHANPGPCIALAENSRLRSSASSRIVAGAAAERGLVQRILANTPYVSQGSTRRREVALTFDDGPGPFTPQVLDVLERMRVPASFFVVGREVSRYGMYLAAELAGNFAVGNHTEDHALLPALSPAAQSAQIGEQVTAIRSCGAPYPALFRPPYGGFNSVTLGLLRRSGMIMVLWSVDTKDYTRPGVTTIVRRALAGAVPGAIILMHDGDLARGQTVAALPKIIAGLRARHLEPVTIPRLLHDDPPDPKQPPPQSLSIPVGAAPQPNSAH